MADPTDLDPESPAPVDSTELDTTASDEPASVPEPSDQEIAEDQQSSEETAQPTQEVQPAASVNQDMQAAPATLPPPPTAQDLDQQALGIAQDFASGAIHPKTYQSLFNNESTLGKIGTIFGLLVGGAGSGLTHGPNVVMDMMNREIQNDLEAQKASKENQMNFLRLSQQHALQQAQIGQIQAETGLTPQRKQLLQSQTQQAQAEANLIGTNTALNNMKLAAFQHLQDQVNMMPPQQQPQAQSTLNTVVGPAIQNDIQQRNAQTAGKVQMLRALNPNLQQQTQQMDPDQAFKQQNAQLRMAGLDTIANDQAARYIPGVGMAAVPVSGADREKLLSGQQFQNELAGFINWTKAHSGDLSPSDINEGQTRAAELQGAYRQATGGGVYKEGEQNFISKLINDQPTEFFNEIRVIPQLKAIQSEAAGRMSTLSKSLGLPKSPTVTPTWTTPQTQQQGTPIQTSSQFPAAGTIRTTSSGRKFIADGNGGWSLQQ